MKPTIPRTASAPVAGALRVGVDVSLANIAVYFAAQVVPDAILGDVENLIIVGISAGLAALGKWLRDQGRLAGALI